MTWGTALIPLPHFAAILHRLAIFTIGRNQRADLMLELIHDCIKT